MTRPLALTQHQTQVLLRAAEAEGGIVEVRKGDTVIRLIPASLAKIETQPLAKPKGVDF